MTLKEKLKQIKKFLNIEHHVEAKDIKWTSVECMNDDNWEHGGNVNDVVEEIGMTENYSPMEDYVDIELDNGYSAFSINSEHDNFIEFCDKCIANNVRLIVCSHEFGLTPERRKKLIELRDLGIIFLCASGNKGEEITYSDSENCNIDSTNVVFHVTSFYLDSNGKMCWGNHNYGNDIEMIAPTMIPIDVDEDGILDENPNGTSFSAPCMLELLRMAIKLNDKINSKTLLDFLDKVGTDVTFNGYTYKYLIYNEEKIKEFMKEELNDDKQVEEKKSWKTEFDEAWEKATEKGIVDGTRPNENITRNELVVILDRLHLIE